MLDRDDEGLFGRLYLDEDVHKGVAAALRVRHFDAISAHETGAWGLTDEEQLAVAAGQGRALLTFNTADFARLHRAWLAAGREHWGIILCEQLTVGEVTRRVLALLNRVTAHELHNQLYWLPDSR